jgi:hypothetical protein
LDRSGGEGCTLPSRIFAISMTTKRDSRRFEDDLGGFEERLRL